MNPSDKARAWKLIESMIDKVQDPVLKKSMLGEMAMRARAEWGYCPSKKQIEDVELQLEDWEREFFDELKIAIAYGVPMKDEKREVENMIWMMKFVRDGGNLSDIPDDVRSEYVDDLYFECLKAYGEEIDALADWIIGRIK